MHTIVNWLLNEVFKCHEKEKFSRLHRAFVYMVIRLMGWEVQTGWRHFYIRKLQTLALTGIEEEK